MRLPDRRDQLLAIFPHAYDLRLSCVLGISHSAFTSTVKGLRGSTHQHLLIERSKMLDDCSCCVRIALCEPVATVYATRLPTL